MNSLKRYIFLTVMMMTIVACNRNFHSYISPSNFLVNNWYKFDNFRYEGPLSNGLPNGFGTVVYNNGTRVSGHFVNGVLNDKEAKYTIPKVGDIEGVVVSGQLVSGQIRYTNGAIYTGKIKSYAPDGNGVLIRSNNDLFEGKFQGGNFLSGEFYESKTGSTFQGSFKNFQPDGEVVEIKSNGKASTHIYSGGTDQTKLILDDKVKRIIKKQNEAELNKIEEENTRLAKQVQDKEKSFSKEKERIEEEGGEMYNRCACTLGLKICLTVYSAGEENYYRYGAYYEEFGLPAPYGPIYGHTSGVSVPIGSSKAVIKQAFLNQIEFISECVNWNSDRDNYERLYKDKLANLVASHQQYMQNAKAEIEEKQREKELAYQRQESERQMRLEAELSKIKNELNLKAQKAAKQRQERCAKNPDCCLSTASIQKLKAAKQYSPCATQQ